MGFDKGQNLLKLYQIRDGDSMKNVKNKFTAAVGLF